MKSDCKKTVESTIPDITINANSLKTITVGYFIHGAIQYIRDPRLFNKFYSDGFGHLIPQRLTFSNYIKKNKIKRNKQIYGVKFRL